jgi:GT2 family glycosyltransferase
MSEQPSFSGTKSTYSIVLVNYKTLEITKICLDLLQRGLQGAAIPVWVVDNDSGDASTEYLRALDWINLLERTPQPREPGHMAHGNALDLALQHVQTDYLFLLHTDTFVFDASVFEMMMAKCMADNQVAAVGCVEQMDRGLIRTYWRLTTRFLKHYARRLKLFLGLDSKNPKPFKEEYLKSFCTLWNVRLIKAHGLRFQLDERIPGYALQEQMLERGYKIEFLSPRKIFRYLDHVQAGTVAAAGGYHPNHRRSKMYKKMLARNISG